MNDKSWKTIVDARLPLMGHRNWIGVVDSAYPWQTASGIETIVTSADHMAVLKYVHDSLRSVRHVRPLVHVDRELAAVTDSLAPGADALRKKLLALLAKCETASTPHDATIRRLDKASALFRVLLLKSTLTIPYTSVFFELDCGYWSAAAERTLRKSLSRKI